MTDLIQAIFANRVGICATSDSIWEFWSCLNSKSSEKANYSIIIKMGSDFLHYYIIYIIWDIITRNKSPGFFFNYLKACIFIKELLRKGISEALKISHRPACCENTCFHISSTPIECYCKSIYWDYCFSYIPTLYGGFPDIFNGLYTTVFTVNRGRIHDANPIYTK